MQLALLVGNSRLRCARIESGAVAMRTVVEFADFERAGPATLETIAGGAVPEKIVAASVRDDLFARAIAALPSGWPAPLVARRDFPIPIENRYERPDEVGTDRLLNAVAARELFPGASCVVVDFGTATSLSAVSAEGAFVGGLIGAGATAVQKALSIATPRLPAIELAPPRGAAIARRTLTALEGGVFRQLAGGANALVEAVCAELPGARVIATGGQARLFAPSIPAIERIEDDLTLDGLLAAWAAHEAP